MCMACHGLFKKTIGKNQRLNVFVWGMRGIVVGLNIMPIYLMNYVRGPDEYEWNYRK